MNRLETARTVSIRETPEFPETVDLSLGKIGKFEVKRYLGRGAMGVVYEAYDSARNRQVAVKIVRAPHSAQSLSLALGEARALAQLAHPNVMFLYGAESWNEGLILVMELLARGTLADHVRRLGPARVEQAVTWTLDLLKGLEALESHGLVHRDIKPSNCFLGEGGLAKIGDLGLATVRQASRTDGAPGYVVGTPLYSSPEQLRGENVDHRADIYALGCTLYEILAGRPAFRPQRFANHVAAVEASRYMSLRALRPECPQGLANVVARAMEPRITKRFQTADAFAEALRPYILDTSAREPRRFLRVASFFAEQLALGVLAGIPALVITANLSQVMLGVPVGVESRWVLSRVLGWILGFVYFGLCEGFTGTTLVRFFVGLRVVDRQGAPPGLRRALLRNLVLFGALALLSSLFVMLPELDTRRSFSFAYIAWLVSMFAFTDSRGVHGIVSGTKLVRVAPRKHDEAHEAPRARSPMHQFGGAVHLKKTKRIGRYAASTVLAQDPNYTLLLGVDPLLKRQVWLVEAKPNVLIPPAMRSVVERPSRWRWIDGREESDGAWAAFEAPSDLACFTSVPRENRRSAWTRAAYILQQMASELELGVEERTLPRKIGLSSVFLDRNDRLILADVPLQAILRQREDTFEHTDEGLRDFLQALVVALRTGETPPYESTDELRLWNDASRVLLSGLWREERDVGQIIREISAAMPDPG